MKGFNKRGCYRYGGTLKTKTVAGLKTGNHDNPNVLRAMRGHEGGSADGCAGRGSLARPTRKRADGGGVSRISEDSRREAARLRQEEADAPIGLGNPNSLLAGAGAGTALHFLGRSRMPVPIRGLMGAAGLGVGAVGAKRTSDDVREMFRTVGNSREADRIERGEAEPGREDRAKGGSVGKKDWISSAIKNPGSLRKSLHVPAGEKIPAKKLNKAAHSDNPTLARRANLAKTLKGFK